MDPAFQWVITIAVVLACIAFLVQAGVSIALLRVAKRIQEKVSPLAERAEPILTTTRQILEENKPRIAEVSTEAVLIARTVHKQADRVGELITDVSERTRTRVAQIENAVDNTVNQVEVAGDAVKTAVLKPVREVNAIMAGIRAAVQTYANAGRRSVDHATQDEEMFI